nr:ATP synthase F0 subunit 8 [Discoporella cookae]
MPHLSPIMWTMLFMSVWVTFFVLLLNSEQSNFKISKN